MKDENTSKRESRENEYCSHDWVRERVLLRFESRSFSVRVPRRERVFLLKENFHFSDILYVEICSLGSVDSVCVSAKGQPSRIGPRNRSCTISGERRPFVFVREIGPQRGGAPRPDIEDISIVHIRYFLFFFFLSSFF